MNSASHAEGGTPGRAKGTDVVVHLPLLRGVTYNEVHSALLGLVGILAGIGFRAGHQGEVAGFTVVAVCVAFGCRRLSGRDIPVARRVVRREPWYFLTVYVATAVVAGLLYPVV